MKQKGKSRMENQGKLTQDTRQTKTNKTKHNKICVGHQHTQDTRHKVKTNKTKHNTICVGHHYKQASTSNVDKTRVLLQTTGGKDDPNIVYMRKSCRSIKS